MTDIRVTNDQKYNFRREIGSFMSLEFIAI
jgi:hypothetical protein